MNTLSSSQPVFFTKENMQTSRDSNTQPSCCAAAETTEPPQQINTNQSQTIEVKVIEESKQHQTDISFDKCKELEQVIQKTTRQRT